VLNRILSGLMYVVSLLFAYNGVCCSQNDSSGMKINICGEINAFIYGDGFGEFFHAYPTLYYDLSESHAVRMSVGLGVIRCEGRKSLDQMGFDAIAELNIMFKAQKPSTDYKYLGFTLIKPWMDYMEYDHLGNTSKMAYISGNWLEDILFVCGLCIHANENCEWNLYLRCPTVPPITDGYRRYRYIMFGCAIRYKI
jgi:hypothetical protein